MIHEDKKGKEQAKIERTCEGRRWVVKLKFSGSTLSLCTLMMVAQSIGYTIFGPVKRSSTALASLEKGMVLTIWMT